MSAGARPAPSIAAPASPARGTVARLALAAALVALVVDAALLLAALPTLANYPYSLDYGEGIVWQQMLSIAAGHGYAPLHTFPAIVFHYPPVYHATVLLAATVVHGDMLVVGRWVSVAATLAGTTFVGLLAALLLRAEDRIAARLGGLIAALVYLSCGPVGLWAPFMRVDMLAGALSLGGLFFALRSVDRPRLIHAASLLFVLAIFTKQVSIAAPAAAFAGLLATRPRIAFVGAASCVLAGGTVFLAIEIATHGEFSKHIFLYNINRIEPSRLALLARPFRSHLIYLACAGLGAAMVLRGVKDRWTDASARCTRIGLLSYLGAKTLLLASIAKSGSGDNYLIEWFAPIAIFAAIAVAPAIATACRPARATRGAQGAGSALLALIALQAAMLARWDPSLAGTMRASAATLAPLHAAIAREPRPVISDDMALLIRAGKPVLWESSITAELGSTGRYDQDGFARLVRAHRFGFFVTEGDRGDGPFDSRYNPPVAAAIADAYPREQRFGGLVVHLPAAAR